MAGLAQRSVPGIVGISTYVDAVYLREIQSAAVAASGSDGPINRLRVAMVALDFKLLLENVLAGRLEAAERQVEETAVALEAAGAGFIVVTSGTTSTLTARARAATSIPFLDLAGAALKEAGAGGSSSVGLLSTRHAAAGGIFQQATKRLGMSLVTPSPSTAERVDEVIFDELVRGRVVDRSVDILSAAVGELAELGATSVVLGNTDMTLAADRIAERAPVAIVDSARAHARAATRAALDGESDLFGD